MKTSTNFMHSATLLNLEVGAAVPIFLLPTVNLTTKVNLGDYVYPDATDYK